MKFGESIYKTRLATRLNQEQFADKIGIDKTYLSQLENNKKTPSIKLLEKISEISSIPLQILFFNSLTKDDIPENKRELFEILFPRIVEMMNSLFSENKSE